MKESFVNIEELEDIYLRLNYRAEEKQELLEITKIYCKDEECNNIVIGKRVDGWDYNSVYRFTILDRDTLIFLYDYLECEEEFQAIDYFSYTCIVCSNECTEVLIYRN
jgi:hypothetical protein